MLSKSYYSNSFSSIFDDFFKSSFNETISTKFKKNEEGWNLKFNFSGLSKDDLKITVKEDVLKIVNETENEWTGKFEKTYIIPENVEFNKITSKMENGILEIVLPFKVEQKKLDKEKIITIQ